MFYLDNRQFKIVEISRKDIIHEFSEKTTSPRGVEPIYFYEDGALCRWSIDGKKIRLQECSGAKAESILYSYAEGDAADLHNIYFYNTLDELKAYIRLLIEDCAETEEEKRYLEKLL